MATVRTEFDDTVYVLVSAVDGVLQNVSTSPVRVCFSATLPAVDTDNYHFIEKGEFLTKSGGVPADSIYVRAESGKSGVVSFSAFGGVHI